MNLVYPSVELWEQENPVSHIAKCARVCYASESKNDDADVRLVESLENKGHLSMFRHESKYFIIKKYSVGQNIYNSFYNKLREFKYCPFISYIVKNNTIYISTNGQFYNLLVNTSDDRFGFVNIKDILDYEVSSEEFKQTDEGWSLMRYTFCVVTQISTSRELNRTSPNNIAEQSTRYIDFGKKGNITICLPHWWDNASWFKKTIHKIYWKSCELMYKFLLKLGFLPQDARGVLPLDTATKVVYTYNVDEWEHILDLRFYGVTGKPHPNAKLVAYQILTKLRELGYEL